MGFGNLHSGFIPEIHDFTPLTVRRPTRVFNKEVPRTAYK